jgi:hypothetical protein
MIAKEIGKGKMAINSAALDRGQKIQILSLQSSVQTLYVCHAEMKSNIYSKFRLGNETL